MTELIKESVAVCAVVFLVSESAALAPFRQWLDRTGWGLRVGRHRWEISSLVRCGYCLAHWVSALCLTVCPSYLGLPWRWGWLDWPASALVVAWLASVQWLAMKLMFCRLRDGIHAAEPKPITKSPDDEDA